MKSESEPVTPDEWLIRLVWETKLKGPLVARSAFEPLPNDTTGLSLFRAACLHEPTDALLAIAPEKRPRYGIVQIPVSLVTALSLAVVSDPIPQVPGHVLIPELNSAGYAAGQALLLPKARELAELASQHILRRPTPAG